MRDISGSMHPHNSHLIRKKNNTKHNNNNNKNKNNNNKNKNNKTNINSSKDGKTAAKIQL